MELAGIHPVTAPDPRASQAPDRLRRLCGEIVGSVFYGTLLKTVGESPLKGAYGHGGRGEEVFSAQLHGLLAEQAGAARADGLADALYGRLRAKAERLSPGDSNPAREIRHG